MMEAYFIADEEKRIGRQIVHRFGAAWSQIEAIAIRDPWEKKFGYNYANFGRKPAL